MKRISLNEGKRKLILLLPLLFLGVIMGEKLVQHKDPVETVLERHLVKTLPISWMQAKPGSTLYSPTKPLLSYLETLSLSNDGKTLALWLEPLRWCGKFCLFDINGKEEISSDFDDFSLEILFPTYFMDAAYPSHISWAPDNLKVALSARKVSPPETEEEEKTFKKWLTVIHDFPNKTFKTLRGYSVVNVVKPWEASDDEILLKKEEGEKSFSLALLSLSSQEIIWSLTPKSFPLRTDDVIARDNGKIYVFEQALLGEYKIWTIDLSSKEEKLSLNLKLEKGFRYYSIPSQNLKYLLLVAVPEKYPLELSGEKSFSEVRELSTGRLVKKLSFEDSWLHFLRWSPDATKIALIKFNTSEGSLIVWDIEKEKLYKVPLSNEETIEGIDFSPASSSLYFLQRENIKECNIYRVDLPDK